MNIIEPVVENTGISLLWINYGDVFKFDGSYYMKVNGYPYETFNAVNIKNGNLRFLDKLSVVEPISNASMVIK